MMLVSLQLIYKENSRKTYTGHVTNTPKQSFGKIQNGPNMAAEFHASLLSI